MCAIMVIYNPWGRIRQRKAEEEMGMEVAISYRMVKEMVSRKILSPEMTWHVYRIPRRQRHLRHVVNKAG